MKLAWITDPHFELLQSFAPREFMRCITEETSCDAFLVSGDIANGPGLKQTLEEMAQGAKCPIYFVLGNHDYYDMKIAEVDELASSCEDVGVYFLDRCDPVELSPTTALVGVGGWYDVLLGLGEDSPLTLDDWKRLGDFKGKTKSEIVDLVRNLSKSSASLAQTKLSAAAARYQQIYFLTHYPPFKEASHYQDTLSDDTWLPWFSSKTMGEALSKVAQEYKDTYFTTLCGHTHFEGEVQPYPNLTVVTGRAKYGAPDVARTFEI